MEAKESAMLLAGMMGGHMRGFYDDCVRTARTVKVERLSSVVGPDMARTMVGAVRPEVRQCYRNATLMSIGTDRHDVGYAEGFVMFHGIPIEHAINVIDGRYVDVTFEYALGRDPEKEEYVVFGEYDRLDVMRTTYETGYYGSIHLNEWKNKHKSHERHVH